MQEVKEGKDYSFPQEEVEILSFWDAIRAFEGQLERTEGSKPFIFYDGPPFATGLPHYGHLLAGTIKVQGLIALSLAFQSKAVYGYLTYANDLSRQNSFLNPPIWIWRRI